MLDDYDMIGNVVVVASCKLKSKGMRVACQVGTFF